MFILADLFENQGTVSDGTREIPEKRVRANVMRRSKLRDYKTNAMSV